jgi:Tol biopolymer transport system component/DNA-binding winged helix-turn-helix (wHTH) protein
MHDPVEHSAPPVLRFGTFEVDVAAGELRRQGVRTRLQEQPLKVLLLLLSRPGGVVTREELRAQLWPADTFVDFEHSLNAAVKRLRDALGDTADNPRFIETIPKRGYRFLAPMSDSRQPPPVPSTMEVARPRPSWKTAAAAVSVLVALAAAIGWTRWRSDPPARTSGPLLTRLTSDTRLTTDSAVSPDGGLLAYASDRGEEGNLDIWVQQLAGGAALRLTRHVAEDREPAFSPDGTRIAFRSERDGGGIYVISTLGGEEKFIAPQGRRPRFSPTGDAIAYWVGGGIGVIPAEGVSGTSAIYVVPAVGGSPRQLRLEFSMARWPVWAPDGTKILFRGIRDARAAGATPDWWLTPLADGDPVATGMLPAVAGLGLAGPGFAVPDAWAGDHVLFSAQRGDSRNVWQIGMSPDGRPAGEPEQLTFGTGTETHASPLAGGRLVFSSSTSKVEIWSLPAATDEGKTLGVPQRVTETAGQHIHPRLGADGKTLAYVSLESGAGDLWLKDLATGKQTPLTTSPANEHQPIPSKDGSRVAYIWRDRAGSSIKIVSADGGTHERACDGCSLSFNDWSDDGTTILHLRDQPRRIAVLDVSSGRSTDILRHDRFNLYVPRFSPDARWITFLAQTGPENRRLYAARYRGDTPIPASDWIPLTDGRFSDDKPTLSPNGRLLYFTSNRDGSMCLWAQRLDAATKHPLGSPFAVHHFHSNWRSISNVPLPWLGVSVGTDRIILNLGERTGNVWLARTGEQR